MAQTIWGRMYLLVGALNVLWLFCAQFFIDQYTDGPLDWLLSSVLIILPSLFVFGRAFVMGTARLGLVSIVGLAAAVSVLFAGLQIEQAYTYYYFDPDPDLIVFTFSGPLFAVIYAAVSRFANPVPTPKESVVQTSPIDAPAPKRLNKTANNRGIFAAILAAVVSTAYLINYPLTPELEIEDRIAQSIGGGFSALIFSSLTWLLTVVFHRSSFSQWHRSAGWPVFWITVILLAGVAADQANA